MTAREINLDGIEIVMIESGVVVLRLSADQAIALAIMLFASTDDRLNSGTAPLLWNVACESRRLQGLELPGNAFNDTADPLHIAQGLRRYQLAGIVS